ncbi:class I SAM-dependent methyltransferase [Crocinitomicaceae bacterium]|nr:class I SAM-dependent methyltransferase [Crocinitomicaceae bacterium]
MKNAIKWYNSRCDMYLDFPKNGMGLELGVAKGLNSVNLYQAARPKVLQLVDTWDDYSMGHQYIANKNEHWEPFEVETSYEEYLANLYSKEIAEKTIITHKSDVFDFLSEVPDNSFDWVYVDDVHIYAHVKKELYEVIRVTKPNGIVAGHDFRILRRGWGLGPVAAVLEHVQEGSLEILGLSQEDWPSYMCKVKK